MIGVSPIKSMKWSVPDAAVLCGQSGELPAACTNMSAEHVLLT